MVVSREDIDRWLESARLFQVIVDRFLTFDVYSRQPNASAQLREELLRRGVEVK
jgi:hypothetical protein